MNKKIIGLLLTAVIFTGAGSFGTYAYFTSQYTLSEKVDIKMGSVNVVAEWRNNGAKAETWAIEEVNQEAEQGKNADGLVVSNVKKGTVATRKIRITNNGTLAANVDVILKNPIDGVEVTFNESKGNTYSINNMKPGTYVDLTIKVKVSKKPANKPESIFNGEIKDFVIVNAEQLK